MFYYPNRVRAQKIQKVLENLYLGVDGEYHYGDDAWKYVKEYTKVDLKSLLEQIATERANGN